MIGLRRGVSRTRAVLALRAPRVTVWPPRVGVRYGMLRRDQPYSPMWPCRRGQPVDRYYIERFLKRNAAVMVGDLLEVGGLEYIERLAQPRFVRSASSLHAPAGAPPSVTYVADLADAPELPSAHFDCIVLPQTLQFIYDVRAAVDRLHEMLRPGGVLLVTVPGISHSVPGDKELWGQYWSFTDDSLRRLFGEAFGSNNVTIASHGNVLTASAFLYGLAVEDLERATFERDDPAYPLILTVRAERALGP